MALLIETRLNSLKLNESAQPRKGCLGRLEGICADFKNPTRNGRLYTLELWKNVFNDPIFKESLESKTLLGELDHPEDRLEVLAGEACIVMTDYRIDEDEGVIYAGFDILDTPRGKILKTLLDYGCVMGVSSRGQGDITNTAEGERVDEDTYDFACFDVVTTPAVEKARQNVVESVKKTKCFVESIKKQIDEAETVGDLNAIKRVVQATQSAEADSLLESIQDKCNSIKEGKTITSQSEELQESIVNNVENHVETDTNDTDTNNVSAKTIREHKELFSCLNDMRKQVSAYKHRESRLLQVINKKDLEIENLTSKNKMLLNVQRENNKLQQQCEKLKRSKEVTSNKLQETINSKDNQLKSLSTKVSRQQTNLNSVKDNLHSVQQDLNSSYSNIKELRENINAKDSIITKLQNEVTTKNNRLHSLQETLNSCKSQTNADKQTIEELQFTINDLNEKLQALESDMRTTVNESNNTTGQMELEINQYSGLVDSLHGEVNNLKSELTETINVNKKLTAKIKKLSEQLNNYQQNYVNTKSRQFGIDAESVKKFVTADTSVNQVNKIVEELQQTKDRYAKLPISESMPTGVVINSANITKKSAESDEDDRLTKFVESITNANK